MSQTMSQMGSTQTKSEMDNLCAAFTPRKPHVSCPVPIRGFWCFRARSGGLTPLQNKSYHNLICLHQPKNKDSYIESRGSGHDAHQYSIANAKESNCFRLTCSAPGHRDGKSITTFFPQWYCSSCECISCPSTVTFKCVEDISCS